MNGWCPPGIQDGNSRWRQLVLVWRPLALCALLWSPCQGNGLVTIHSERLHREVPVALHVPAADILVPWIKAHPGSRMLLVLFLPGAFDGPEEFLKEGLEAFLSDQEAKGTIPPRASGWL